LHFDFSLPGSTHNLRLSGSNSCSLRHSDSVFHTGCGSAEILFDRMSRGQRCKIFYKPFYRRDDFDDERYMPVFSPTAYPGQQVTMMVKVDRMSGESIILNPYIRNSSTKQDMLLSGMVIKDSEWREISFVIPQLDGAMVDEIGLLFEANSPAKNKDMGCIYIDSFSVCGKADYTIDIKKQKKELASITPFSHNHGSWDIENGRIACMCLEHAEAMTGNYYMTDLSVTGELTPHTGTSHLVSARVQGALRGYYGGFTAEGAAILKNDSGMTVLASCPFDRQYDRSYSVCLTAVGNRLTLSIDGKELLSVTDDTHAYGMAGYAMYGLGRCDFGNMTITEL
ncbi:MAG: ADP-ribosylglycohydrolase family protein, partial [Angelakisella sp.]